jgi:signal transduction histidine kinase
MITLHQHLDSKNCTGNPLMWHTWLADDSVLAQVRRSMNHIMKKIYPILTHNRIITILVIALFCLLLLIQLYPPFNPQLWEIRWLVGYIGLAQYYTGFFCSFMTFIVGFSLNEIQKDKHTTRSVFLSTGFFSLSVLLFVNSLTTPDLIFSTNTENLSSGSLDLALLLGGIFFVLSGLQYTPRWEAKLVKSRKLIWLTVPVFILIYALLFFVAIPKPYFIPLLSMQRVVTILLLAWVSLKSLRMFWRNYFDLDYKMAVAFLLMAFTQLAIFLSLNSYGAWFLHVPALVLACLVAITAVLGLLKMSPDVPLVRYFAILGSTLIIAFSIANVEVGIQWIPVPVNRIWLVPFVLVQGVVSFLVLLFVVMRLNILIKQRTDALQHEQHQRAELTQLIVHDLKSPLTVLISGLNLLGNETLGELNNTQKRLLHSLEQSGQDILLMINDLLDVEKMEEGKLQLVQSTFDLIQLTKGCVEASQIVASTHSQNLTFTCDAQNPATIRADKRLIQRVINNLLSNALKFTPNEGQIHVQIQSGREQVTVTVEDSGPGIPVAEQQRIFEKFAQLKGNERRGAGLGLTFCKMVTEAHKGQLNVGSSQFNGALFRLTLPAWQEEVSFGEDIAYSTVQDLSLAK